MAGNFNPEIEIGEDFELALRWTIDGVPVNLTGATAQMQVRSGKINGELYLDLNTTNGKIVITNAADGRFKLVLPSSVTRLIKWDNGEYDLWILLPSRAKKLLTGKVCTIKSITVLT